MCKLELYVGINNDIKLINITSDNWEKICCLYPGKEGAEYVAPNSFSIAQSVFEKGWIIKGIAKGDLEEIFCLKH